MLAQNFRTAAELGLTDKQLEALIKVLGVLERQETFYVPNARGLDEGPAPTPVGFNMEWVFGQSDCGTTACILGWAMHFAGENSFDGVMPGKLLELFLYQTPTPSKSEAWRATPAQAAIAIRNYLTFGEPRWHEALSDI